MHNRLRKACCRLIFILAIAMPTVTMVGWSISRDLPFLQYRNRLHWQQQLGDRLGMQVTLQGLETPGPGCVLLQGVALSDPETGKPCASIQSIRWETQAGRQVVHLERPRLQMNGSYAAWRWMLEGVLRRSDLTNLVMTSDSVDLLGQEDMRPLNGIQFACQVQFSPAQTTLTINMQHADNGKDPVALQVQRQHGTVMTQVSLDTAGAALPCSLLAPLFPRLAALGPDAGFRGQLSAEKTAAGQVLDIAGDLEAVDLTYWLGTIGANGLTGKARLQLRQARIIDDVCVQAEGNLVARDGKVQRSLLDRCAVELGLQLVHRLSESQGDYQQLALGFQLGKRGLQLFGTPGGPYPGAVLTSPQGVLLSATNLGQRVSSQSLARSMGLPDATGMPMSRTGLRQLQQSGRGPVLQARPAPAFRPDLQR